MQFLRPICMYSPRMVAHRGTGHHHKIGDRQHEVLQKRQPCHRFVKHVKLSRFILHFHAFEIWLSLQREFWEATEADLPIPRLLGFTRAILIVMENLLTIEQLAKVLGLSVQTIYNRRCNGGPLPPFVVIGGGQLRCVPEDVSAWLKTQYESNRPIEEVERESAVLFQSRRRGRPTKAEEIRRRKLHPIPGTAA